MAGDGGDSPAGCVLLAASDDTRRAELRHALERRRIRVLTVSMIVDAARGGRAERCDALLVALGGGVRLRDAVGLRKRLRDRSGRPVPSVALVPAEDGTQAARVRAAGFDLVLGRLATPEQVAVVVERLRAGREAGSSGGPPTDVP